MTTLSVQVSAGGNDGYCSSASFFNTGYGEIDFGNNGGALYHSFFLVALAIPKGATINSAYIELCNYGDQSGTCNAVVGFQAADNPSIPTSAADANGRTLTTTVEWVPGAWSGSYTAYQSPDLKTALQEIVDRAGWVSGNNVLVFVRENGSATNGLRQATSYDGYNIKAPKLVVDYDASKYGDFSDAAGAGDSVDAFSLTDGITDGAGAGDAVEGYDFKGEISDAAGAGDLVEATGEPLGGFADAAGAGDSVDAAAELVNNALTDGAGIADDVDGFNWSAWLRTNRGLAITRFYLTITGADDLTTDVEIPMSSFQARKRTANPTYVSAVVPFTVAIVDALEARASGEMVIEMAYLIDGVESVREEILRADLEQINPQQGPGSRAITLIGHKTITYANQDTVLTDPIYKYTSDGRMGFRFAVPDPYLNPGDTAIVGEDEFTVDAVVYMVSAGSGQTVMEVQE